MMCNNEMKYDEMIIMILMKPMIMKWHNNDDNENDNVIMK